MWEKWGTISAKSILRITYLFIVDAHYIVLYTEICRYHVTTSGVHISKLCYTTTIFYHYLFFMYVFFLIFSRIFEAFALEFLRKSWNIWNTDVDNMFMHAFNYIILCYPLWKAYIIEVKANLIRGYLFCYIRLSLWERTFILRKYLNSMLD